MALPIPMATMRYVTYGRAETETRTQADRHARRFLGILRRRCLKPCNGAVSGNKFKRLDNSFTFS